jgi:phosphatidylinositol dimannoside acyltransferase
MVAYLAMRIGMGIVGLLPYRVAVALGQRIGRAYALLNSGRRTMVERHARRLGIPPNEIKAHVREVYAAYGRYWAEALWLRPRHQAFIEAHTTDSGLEAVEAARDAGRGMIFALPHMGNWEYAAPIAHRLNLNVLAVAENLRNRRIRNWFLRLRNSMGLNIILATGASQVIRELEAALAQNAAVALLCDRDLRGKGVTVEFFGECTTMPAGPVSLAIRTGAPLFPAATYFHESGHHVVIRPPLEIPDGPDRTARIQTGTQLLARELEALIRAAPAQWHLLQPNWPSDFEAIG